MSAAYKYAWLDAPKLFRQHLATTAPGARWPVLAALPPRPLPALRPGVAIRSPRARAATPSAPRATGLVESQFVVSALS